jgi:hypothetical protein
MPSKHYTNRNNHIFTHRLANDSKFHIEKILNISWTLRNSQQVNRSEILLVFERFRVQNFVWIRRVEIFILNFSRWRVFNTRTRVYCAIVRSSCSRDDVNLTRVGGLWPISYPEYARSTLTCRIHFWHLLICRVMRYKRRIVLNDRDKRCKFEDTVLQMIL